MAVDSRTLRTERFHQIGHLIQQDAGVIVQRWVQRVAQDHPQAKRVHHEILLDQLHPFLRALATSLAESDDLETCRHRIQAIEHGEQRWETGWSLPEVIQDYQVLRLVLIEYLNETLDRALTSREIMAVGLALDEAITASVGMYVSNRDEFIRQIERERAELAKQAEETRHRLQTEALQEENRRKDDFLATLGHELRNPMAPIRNAVHALSLGEPDKETLTWIKDVVERQIKQMTRLVDDLLDVTRIARGKIKLDRQRFDLVQMVREIAADQQGVLDEGELFLALELPPEPVWVDADPVRLTQIVANLLHNAVKFTNKGGNITLQAMGDKQTSRALIEVRDTGIGIEGSLLPHIFDSYWQADKSVNRSGGGLGLGLTLVKGLVELHGGQVQARSAGTGQGAEFAFWIPLSGE